MKARREHRIPLSREALAVLRKARDLGDGRYCFPAPRGGALYTPALRRVALAAKAATPHGLRSAFRSWCADTAVERPVAEACLAHTVRGVEGAYQRSDVLDRRREVMEAWGRYIDG